VTGALDLAHQLIEHGVPVVVVRGGTKFPSKWVDAPADRSTLKGFRPGVDALLMVCGHGIDVVDVDTAKDGNSVGNMPPFKPYGEVVTPSGGAHFYVPSSGIGSPVIPGVGEYRGLGGGAFIPGSYRPKYPDGEYQLLGLDWSVLTAAADPDLTLFLGGLHEHHVYIDTSPERVEPGIHPYAEAAISRELGRLRACQEDGWEGEPWNGTTYAVACNLIELANSNWTGYTLEQAHADLLELAPADEAFGPREHEERWDSALQKVGQGGRPNPDEQVQHQIWDASPVLKHIQQAAHSRMVGSGALLCYVLGRVLAEAPPHVVLPPVVGSAAPLNLAFALVGKSGTGKSGAGRVSAELMGLNQDPIETGVGSGEGLIESYLEPDPNNPRPGSKRLVAPPSRILDIDEIGRLGSVAKREGSSMMHVLRSGLTGGALKTANASTERIRNVPPGVYRLVVFAGVQPELSDVLLGEANAGTPQRFCWVSSTDPTVPEYPPEWPGELGWSPMRLDLMGPTEIDYPEHIKAEIKRERWRAVTDQEGVDPLHGHRMLTQLKVAAALALLHDEDKISDQWWDIAAHLMRWSEKEQQKCLRSLREAQMRKAAARGQQLAVEQGVVAKSVTEKAGAAVLRALDRGLASWKDIRSSVSQAHREVFEDAVEQLVKDGKVAVVDGTHRGRVTRKLERTG
jgi:hypothetical protein